MAFLLNSDHPLTLMIWIMIWAMVQHVFHHNLTHPYSYVIHLHTNVVSHRISHTGSIIQLLRYTRINAYKHNRLVRYFSKDFQRWMFILQSMFVQLKAVTLSLRDINKREEERDIEKKQDRVVQLTTTSTDFKQSGQYISGRGRGRGCYSNRAASPAP